MKYDLEAVMHEEKGVVYLQQQQKKKKKKNVTKNAEGYIPLLYRAGGRGK